MTNAVMHFYTRNDEHWSRFILRSVGMSFLVLIILSMLSGCTDYGRMTKIARATLYDAKGKPDESAFRGALIQKFPAGSPVKPLIDYSNSSGGYCTYGAHDMLKYCQVPFGRDECSVQILLLKVAVENERISSLEVDIGEPVICD